MYKLQLALLLATSFCFSQNTSITDANFLTAINTCLTNNPKDGMCSKSEYGAMPTWDVSQVTDMRGAFKGNVTFNGDISSWNTSSVANIAAMFDGATAFNQDVSSWDVSSVTDMDYMFYDAVLFNKNLWNWQLNSGAVSVTNMFSSATAALALGYTETPSITQDSNGIWRLSDVTPQNLFQPTTKAELQAAVNGWIDGTITADSPVPSGQGSGTYGVMNTWDISLITDMSSLFEQKQNFNEDISNWNVSSVITMVSMFEEATAFNQDISSWDVSQVTDMSYMFVGASTFNQDISAWCVTNIASEPTSFSPNSPLSESNKPVWGTCPKTPITDANFQTAINTCLTTNPEDGMCSDSEYGAMPDWDVSQVTDMNEAFGEKTDFNGDISAWNTSSVTNMYEMFAGAFSFNQDISEWDVISVTNMEAMFYQASAFNQPLDDWDVSSVTNMSYMFNQASTFNQDISSWDVSSVTEMSYMFWNSVLFNKNLWNWQLNSGAVSVTEMFYGAMAALTLGYTETPSITQDSNGIWRLSDVTPQNLFQPTTKAELQAAVNGWIDGTITADSLVPSGQGSGTYGAINTWDVSLITDMSNLFSNKQNFNEDISNWDVSNVTN
uniref:BspA family leucine-rich repeat surface protein n=1 Tax=Winogradskyella sp. TaxID=1883156 RepID=UPI0035C78C58